MLAATGLFGSSWSLAGAYLIKEGAQTASASMIGLGVPASVIGSVLDTIFVGYLCAPEKTGNMLGHCCNGVYNFFCISEDSSDVESNFAKIPNLK